jgi:hypothetical protein
MALFDRGCVRTHRCDWVRKNLLRTSMQGAVRGLFNRCIYNSGSYFYSAIPPAGFRTAWTQAGHQLRYGSVQRARRQRYARIAAPLTAVDRGVVVVASNRCAVVGRFLVPMHENAAHRDAGQ